MKKIISILCSCAFVLLSFSSQAQVENPTSFSTDGNTYVFKDPRINLLIQHQKYINTLALRNVTGYRVQVLSTINRSDANQARAKLMKLFPKYETYLNYQSPYFRVRIGNFLQRDSAEVLQKELGQYFPNGVFTVRDRINIDPEVLLQQVKSQHGTRN